MFISVCFSLISFPFSWWNFLVRKHTSLGNFPLLPSFLSRIQVHHDKASQVALVIKNLSPPASTGGEGDTGSNLGLGKRPSAGNSNPLQYSCLENPMDRGAWWATIPGVAKSWTRLSDQACMISIRNSGFSFCLWISFILHLFMLHLAEFALSWTQCKLVSFLMIRNLLNYYFINNLELILLIFLKSEIFFRNGHDSLMTLFRIFHCTYYVTLWGCAQW